MRQAMSCLTEGVCAVASASTLAVVRTDARKDAGAYKPAVAGKHAGGHRTMSPDTH